MKGHDTRAVKKAIAKHGEKVPCIDANDGNKIIKSPFIFLSPASRSCRVHRNVVSAGYVAVMGI